MKLRQLILSYLNDERYNPLTFEELSDVFEIDKREGRLFQEVLRDLEKEGHIRYTKKDRIMPVAHQSVTGTIQASERGFAFFIPDDGSEDVFIPANDRNGAMHGDKVKIKVTEASQGEKNAVGKVVKVTERATQEVVGVFYKKKNFGFVEPIDQKFDADIYLPEDQIKGLKTGDMVIVSVEYPKNNKGPAGAIKEKLGGKDEPGIDITAIARTHGLPYEFPEEAIEQAEKLDGTITLGDRKDFRDLHTVTIDGPDSKDFDDAISIQKEGENYRLFVHIADVAHYVKEGSPIDKEAYQRGNSVYLLDRVIPMLPERLSNELCSLVPNEDRYTQSVEMLVNPKGEVKEYFFYSSMIHSNYRLVYPEVSDFLEGKEHPYTDEMLMEQLTWMKELYEILDTMRTQKGSLDFNFAETAIRLDEMGRPIDIQRAERRVGNKIIEEFMVLTNEVVGSHFAHLKVPILYRIHEKPSPEKEQTLRTLLHNFNHTIKGKEIHPKDLQKVLLDSAGKKEAPLLHMLILRSLSKARYGIETEIHFGLASTHYAHFTSPIRRYADLVVHRVLYKEIKGLPHDTSPERADRLAKIGEHVSDTEQKAENAERDVEDLKMAEYMEQHIGECFEGMISSITNFGMFIQLENTVEGLIHLKNMDGFYEFHEEDYSLRKRDGDTVYRLGDIVNICVDKVDIERKQIDFRLADEEEQHEDTRTK